VGGERAWGPLLGSRGRSGNGPLAGPSWPRWAPVRLDGRRAGTPLSRRGPTRSRRGRSPRPEGRRPRRGPRVDRPFAGGLSPGRIAGVHSGRGRTARVQRRLAADRSKAKGPLRAPSPELAGARSGTERGDGALNHAAWCSDKHGGLPLLRRPLLERLSPGRLDRPWAKGPRAEAVTTLRIRGRASTGLSLMQRARTLRWLVGAGPRSSARRSADALDGLAYNGPLGSPDPRASSPTTPAIRDARRLRRLIEPACRAPRASTPSLWLAVK